MTYGEPMDFPNTTGWWAFGGVEQGGQRQVRFVFRVTDYTDDMQRDVAIECSGPAIIRSDNPCVWIPKTVSRRNFKGSYYRIYMPWEQQPAPSVPDDVREAIEGMMYYLDNELDETHVGDCVATAKAWLDQQPRKGGE